MFLGAELLTRLAKRHASEEELPGYVAMPVWIMIGILVGARALYVIVEILRGGEVGQAYVNNVFKMFAFWEGGLVMYGGAAGGIVAGLLCARKYSLSLANTLDLGVIASYFGLAIGRVGCLLVGDDYGRVVPEGKSYPFPIAVRVPETLPEGSLFGEENAGQLLYATQVWMSLDALLMAAIGYIILKRRAYRGQVALVVLFLYSIARTVIEHFRGDAIRGLWFNDTLSTSQVISIALGVLCLGLLIKNVIRRPASPETQAG